MKTIHRLEQALNFWEDYCFKHFVMYQISMACGQSPASGMRGALINYKDLRRSILNIFSANPVELTEKFVFPKEALQLNCDLQALYFPNAVLNWARDSRRVFSLSHDLQALLDATSLEGVTWSDIRLPFKSFVVLLGQPLVGSKAQQFDCILVSTVHLILEGKANKRLAFIPLDTKLEDYQPLSVVAKEQVLTLLRKKDFRRTQSKLHDLTSGTRQNPTTSISMIDDSYDNVPILESWEKLRRENAEKRKASRIDDEFYDPGTLYESIMRIVAGMCLYLKTLPTKTSLVSDWKKPEPYKIPNQRGRAITTEAEICQVSSQFTLSTEEREIFGGKEGEIVKSFGEKCCHFRRGTWCRPAGHGDDPNYPRTIWRRPTLVRADKLQPGELPRGAETILLK